MKAKLPFRRAILERRTYEPPAEGRGNKVRLDFNENTAGCSPAVLRALAKLSEKQLAMYPEYQAPTRRLARYFGVRPGELLLANGGDDALRVFFDAFVSAGSHILICEPTFPMYRYYAEIFGAKIDVLRYGRAMEFPLDGVIAALKKKPRVLFIANPNNPTGTLAPQEGLRKIFDAATHTAVVIDEAYAEFSGVTVVPWIRRYPQLFVVRTFSKAAGLAALRLGVVIANAESLSLLRRAMPPFPVNVAALVAAKIIPDASHIWWCIRPSLSYPTLELRITDSNPRLDYGRCDRDNTHAFASSANVDLGHGLGAGMVFRTYSGYPINETVGTDVNGDGTSNDRPTRGVNDLTLPIVSPLDSRGVAIRNGIKGVHKTILDSRFQYQRRMGRYQAGFFLEVYNLTNHANFGNPTGARNSANFMKVIVADQPRTAQLGFRLLF